MATTIDVSLIMTPLTREELNTNKPVLLLDEVRTVKETDGRIVLIKGDGITTGDLLPTIAGGGGGLAGTNYIFVQGNGTPEENGLELSEAIDNANAFNPTEENKFTVLIAPGRYKLVDAKEVKSNVVLSSLSNHTGVFIESINKDFDGVSSLVHGGGVGKVYINGIGFDSAFYGDGSNLRAYNTSGVIASLEMSGEYTNCIIDNFLPDHISFGSFINCRFTRITKADIEGSASGKFYNCIDKDGQLINFVI